MMMEQIDSQLVFPTFTHIYNYSIAFSRNHNHNNNAMVLSVASSDLTPIHVDNYLVYLWLFYATNNII